MKYAQHLLEMFTFGLQSYLNALLLSTQLKGGTAQHVLLTHFYNSKYKYITLGKNTIDSFDIASEGFYTVKVLFFLPDVSPIKEI